MGHFQAVTTSNTPRLKPGTANALEEHLNGYYLGDEIVVSLKDDFLKLTGYDWLSAQKYTDGERTDLEDEECTMDFLKGIQPYLEETLIIQCIGNKECEFPLNMAEVIVPPEGDIVRCLLDGKGNQALVKEEPDSEEDDYLLRGSSCWITAGDFSVHLKKTDEKVAVDIYPLHEENANPVSQAEAYADDLDRAAPGM